jgi:VCBS repeat-containing protein/ELWxxDGT repeat protein
VATYWRPEYSESFGYEPYVSGDGATYRLVKDVNPGPGSSLPYFYAQIGNIVFFTADNGSNGVELWRSDSSETGTFLLKDINAGAASTNISDVRVVGSELYFTAYDGTSTNQWKTNGTTAGTMLVPSSVSAIIGTPTLSSVTEDTGVNASGHLTASGTISISDPDPGEASFRTTITSATGNLGNLSLQANGTYTYTVANASVQFLASSQTKVDTFTVTSADGTTKDVGFTIQGQDEPVSARTDIYRFFRPDNGFHFFTASEAERDSILANLPHYKYEGNAFDTTATALTGDEVFRFFRADNGTHFYTISEAERDSIIANLPHYKYEGAAYHAYETNVGGGHEELYRFFRPDNGTHFFTASEAERDSIMANLPHYKYEGIAYYVDIA